MMDGGVRRGSHVLKALSIGAKAVGVGRYYLFPLAVAGQRGVERALGLMREEIERAMKLGLEGGVVGLVPLPPVAEADHQPGDVGGVVGCREANHGRKVSCGHGADRGSFGT